jgi:acyl-CoA dehydrogenase
MSASTLWPRSLARVAGGEDDPYLQDPTLRRLVEFFTRKGTAALRAEDDGERWYQDWLDYQAAHQLYASLLSPARHSSLGHRFDLLRLVRFVEAFGYFSPSHGYSLQVSFLGLFSILMGSNDVLKREAVAALEAGGLFALGVSEKEHGSDLLGNGFSVVETQQGPGVPTAFVAGGRKYYIGNANCAAIVSILARVVPLDGHGRAAARHRTPLALVAVRPATSPGYRTVRRVRTSGVRSAFVGELEVAGHTVPPGDFAAEGRGAWDAVFGTVTLGKFFLGFGSVGICEHAMAEAIGHMRGRVLYRRPVLDMPHIRLATAQAYARLTAMKLYAHRALDYVQAAGTDDRRYLLFCAVQKAKVSTEGVRVMAQLSECVGAWGFEVGSFFESALRDVQLIPGLEGSMHINLGLAAQFADRYLARHNGNGVEARIVPPPSLVLGTAPATENPYLMRARGGRLRSVAFRGFLDAYRPLMRLPNVRRFARQAIAFARFVRLFDVGQQTAPAAEGDGVATEAAAEVDPRVTLCAGHCLATVAYGQLVAENAVLCAVPAPVVSAVFHLLVSDLATAGTTLAALPGLDPHHSERAARLAAIPRATASDWDRVADHFRTLEGG